MQLEAHARVDWRTTLPSALSALEEAAYIAKESFGQNSIRISTRRQSIFTCGGTSIAAEFRIISIWSHVLVRIIFAKELTIEREKKKIQSSQQKLQRKKH